MKRKIFMLGFMLLSMLCAQAQSEIRVTGKIACGQDGPIMLIASNPDHGGIDTLGQTTTVNGAFEFTCRVNDITAGFVIKSDDKINIPLIIEDTAIKIHGGPDGIVVEGGEGQELFNRFFAIGAGITNEQRRLEAEYQVAEREKNEAKMKSLQQNFAEYMKKSKEAELELIKSNSDSYVTAFVIASGMQQTDPEELVVRYNLLGEKAKSSTFGRVIEAPVKIIQKLAVGNIMPDFALKTPEGSAVSLKSINGKLKLLDFWASWSAPCRQNNVDLVRLYRDFNPSGLEIFSISFDNKKDTWIKAIGEDGITWTQGSDLLGPKSPLLNEFYIQNLPFTILLDNENRILAKNLEWKVLKETIEEWLKSNSRANK